MAKGTILTIDDDQNLQFVMKEYLEGEDYIVLTAANGSEAETRLSGSDVDVVLLDLGLPDTDGLSLIGKIRARTHAPIIVVSGKTDTADKIVGLELGADDYITKPFHLREMAARIKTVLRRVEKSTGGAGAAPGAAEAPVYEFAGWTMHTGRYELLNPQGAPVELTTGEFQLLRTLTEAAHRTLTRDQLFDVTRGADYDSFDRAIDIQIGRLRKKLDDDPRRPQLIKTVRGIGYMFIADVARKSP